NLFSPYFILPASLFALYVQVGLPGLYFVRTKSFTSTFTVSGVAVPVISKISSAQIALSSVGKVTTGGVRGVRSLFILTVFLYTTLPSAFFPSTVTIFSPSFGTGTPLAFQISPSNTAGLPFTS